MKKKNKQINWHEPYMFPFTKKELRATIKALRYDLDENGYSYIKDNLELELRMLIGDIKIVKDGIEIYDNKRKN